MTIKVIVFDFDGTLVQSNAIKYQAFFQLFPDDDDYEKVIRKVLSEDGEATRYVILERILALLEVSPDTRPHRVADLAHEYNEIVLRGVKRCPECPGAEDLLRELSKRYPLFLSSTTPESALREIVAFREWSGYFQEIFGYPRKKSETLQEVLTREAVNPGQILVVGDGESDKLSAQETGCQFFDASAHPLSDVWRHVQH